MSTYFCTKGHVTKDSFCLFPICHKTSPKRFSASKCDVGNWIPIFKILEVFLGNFWEFLGNFFWGIVCEEFFVRNFLGGIFWEEFFGNSLWNSMGIVNDYLHF